MLPILPVWLSTILLPSRNPGEVGDRIHLALAIRAQYCWHASQPNICSMLNSLCTSLVVSLLLTAPLAAEQKLPDFRRVVTVERPNGVQKLAAMELAEYVGRITRQKLEMVTVSQLPVDAAGLSFFIGDAAMHVLGKDPAPWKQEEYLLRSVPKGLELAGDDDGKANPWAITTRAGSLLAVYTLLDDHLGVHWFWPGPFGEHVPSAPDAVVPELDIRTTPKFLFRSIPQGPSAYQAAAYRQEYMRWARRSRLGSTRSAAFGHAWFDAFLREGDTFKNHPEWFALVGGKRQPPQMCTTNPEVIERMVQHALNGKLDIMHISPSDGGGFCECERCRALDVPGLLAYDNVHPQLSDRIFAYANEVARRVREKNPDRGVGMLAYTYYNRPHEHPDPGTEPLRDVRLSGGGIPRSRGAGRVAHLGRGREEARCEARGPRGLGTSLLRRPAVPARRPDPREPARGLPGRLPRRHRRRQQGLRHAGSELLGPHPRPVGPRVRRRQSDG